MVLSVDLINLLLKHVNADVFPTNLIVESGQRTVFHGRKITDKNTSVVIKACQLDPTTAGRMKREIDILAKLDSKYFPKINFYCILNELDLINLSNTVEIGKSLIIKEYLKNSLYPILITSEDFIIHNDWPYYRSHLSSEKNLVKLLTHIFNALQILWNHHIVHRDLKPANILLREGCSPVIIDLGVAKNLSNNATMLTAWGYRAPCTPQYAAPEQLQDLTGQVSYKSDQFSIGVITYNVLTGEFPYGRISDIGEEGLLRNFANRSPLPIDFFRSDVNPALCRFVGRLISIEPYQRFRTIDAILSSLSEIEAAL